MDTRLNIVFLGLGFFSCLALVTLVQLPGDMMLWREIQNTGHIPVFGLLTLIALFLNRTTGLTARHNIAQEYLIALTAILVTGITIELVQPAIGRDADIGDVLRNLVGSVSFLGLFAAIDTRLGGFWGTKKRIWRNTLAGLSLLLLITALIPASGLLLSQIQRDRAFPVLIDFDAQWPQAYLSIQNARLSRVDAPDSWPAYANTTVAQITLQPAPYPGITLEEPSSDWSGFSRLAFHVYSEEPQAYRLTLRIHDRQHNYRFEDRYNATFTIVPGDNLIHIPIETIRSAPATRAMDMTAIKNLMIFAIGPERPLQFYLSDIQLK